MKKFYTTPEYKRRNTKRSFSSVNQRRKRKNRTSKLTHAGKKQGGFLTSTLANTQFIRPPGIRIVAPTNFSLINNTEETIIYFNNAHEELKKKNRIWFDISEIETLTTDAIAVQIAKIKDDNFHFNSGISGNAPNDENLRKLFIQSGFYDYVHSRGTIKPTNNKKLLIHKITNNRVEPDTAKSACILGLRHTFGNEEIFEPLYDILIEIMQNTNNHAGITRGLHDWWLHVYNHPDSLKTSYTFVDLGSGIFESLPVLSFRRTLLEKVGLKSNIDLLNPLFAGEIKSRTARPERGKGMPQIYECSQDITFEKFILISNDVYADLKTNNYKLMKTQFDGTLFYWEINKN